MSTRRTIPVLTVIFALIFAGLGNYLAARQSADREERFAALSAEVNLLRKQETDRTAGTSGTRPVAPATSMDDDSRASLIADVKRQLQVEMGLLPLALLRERRESFAELYAYDNKGTSSYGTAGYLGNGYFITVKHGVMALGQEGEAEPRRIVSVKLVYNSRELSARVVDAGTARVEVDPGDWAILKVKEPVDLPPLTVNLSYGFDFADPIFRLGNDYSKGIILATGYVGQRTANKLVTCLTDGHPGVSGGGVLNRDGELVGIPIGRMQGDYRFSFILPLRAEMFRKVQF
jgi:S1-C subfamily serine protease